MLKRLCEISIFEHDVCVSLAVAGVEREREPVVAVSRTCDNTLAFFVVCGVEYVSRSVCDEFHRWRDNGDDGDFGGASECAARAPIRAPF